LPPEWEALRTGHPFIEHFLAYFVASLDLCLGWGRPLVVAGRLAAAAAILEALESLTLTHVTNPVVAIGGAAGALSAAQIFKLIVTARNRRLLGN
jgi:hypothetical protein